MKFKNAKYVFIFVLLTFAGLPWFILRLLAKFPHDLMTYFGISLIIPSYVLLIIAYYQLGSSFAVTPQAKKLVTTGLYAKISHPIYTFGLLLIFGFALVIRNVVSAAFLGFALVNVIWRVRRENRVLEEKFGDAYRAYREHVWF
jgi:protein-S-isoprenylcysteine O-methyltransferase Ste14